jgi:hypothetical protein
MPTPSPKRVRVIVSARKSSTGKKKSVKRPTPKVRRTATRRALFGRSPMKERTPEKRRVGAYVPGHPCGRVRSPHEYFGPAERYPVGTRVYLNGIQFQVSYRRTTQTSAKIWRQVKFLSSKKRLDCVRRCAGLVSCE